MINSTKVILVFLTVEIKSRERLKVIYALEGCLALNKLLRAG
jgi:hypothetical protein